MRKLEREEEKAAFSEPDKSVKYFNFFKFLLKGISFMHCELSYWYIVLC